MQSPRLSRSRSRSRSASPCKARRDHRLLHAGRLYAYDGTVYDKLTDPSLYTGSHRHRFDEQGRGRGLHGRDVGAHRFSACATSSTAAGGDIDRCGMRWRAGLREEFYQASVPPWEQRVRSPSQPRTAPRKAQVHRYEAWRTGPDGQLVRDECLTRDWQYGPERFRFEEAAIQRNRGSRHAQQARQDEEREQRSVAAPPEPEDDQPVSVWYVDDQGVRREDRMLTELWSLHNDKLRLAEIEERLGIEPPPEALATDDPDEEVELRWENIQRTLSVSGLPGPAGSPRSVRETTPGHSRRSSCRTSSPSVSSAHSTSRARPGVRPQSPRHWLPRGAATPPRVRQRGYRV